MDWGKLYADLPDEPRIQEVEDECGAAWLLVESMCYCARVADMLPVRRADGTGFIPDTQVSRFGGKKLPVKIKALVRVGLWLRVEGGYVIDPRIWTEEQNLNDSAEKKRQADRDRMAAKRAAARAGQNGHAHV